MERELSFPSPNQRNRYGTSKEQILLAAEKLFAERGFARTTLRDVARASSANTALVGYYFGGKEGLRKAVADIQITKCQSILDSILKLGENVTFEALIATMHELFKFMRSERLLYQLQTWAVVDGGVFAEQMASSLWNLFQCQLRTIISHFNIHLSESEVEVRSLMLSAFLNKYADIRWNFLNVLDFKTPHDLILAEFEQIFCDRVVSAVLGCGSD